MKTTNGQVIAARMALAKIANTDAPLPLIRGIAPLLDACAEIIDEGGKIREDNPAGAAFGEREAILPDTAIPLYPGFSLSYVDFRALREIATFEEV